MQNKDIDKPKLSVIIPVYNGAQYIDRAVKSIIEKNQKVFFDLELILINDGSRDNSEKICMQITKKYPEVVYYVKENGGIASARTYGLGKITGDYVTFMDQDDELLTGYNNFLNYLIKSDANLLITDYYKVYKAGKRHTQYFAETCTLDEIDIEDRIKILVAGNILKTKRKESNMLQFPTTVWNCIFDTKIIKENKLAFKRFVDYEDDWIFLIEYLCNCKKVITMHDAFYGWKINSASESHSHKYIDNLYEKRLKIINWSCEILNLIQCSEVEMSFFRNAYQQKRTIIWCFYNYCWKDPKSYKCYKDNMCNLSTYIDWSHFKEMLMCCTKYEKIILLLLSKSYYKFAYWINRYIMRKRFR